MKHPISQPRKPVRSIVRAAAVIESLASGGKGPSEIAAELGISKGTVFDLLKTLESVGFARQDLTNNRYFLGPALIRISANGASHMDFVEITKPHLQRLSDDTGEVTHLGQRNGFKALYLHRCTSQRVLRMLNLASLVGERSPLHCTSIGKVFMAYMSDEEFSAYVKLDRKKYTKHTIMDVQQLEAERVNVREQGYALNIGEFEEGVSSIAVPLRLFDGPVTLGINFAMPSIRMPKECIPGLVEKITMTATEIRKDFGIK
jgi:DNA-binding IclR family transcriptional regulator